MNYFTENRDGPEVYYNNNLKTLLYIQISVYITSKVESHTIIRSINTFIAQSNALNEDKDKYTLSAILKKKNKRTNSPSVHSICKINGNKRGRNSLPVDSFQNTGYKKSLLLPGNSKNVIVRTAADYELLHQGKLTKPRARELEN